MLKRNVLFFSIFIVAMLLGAFLRFNNADYTRFGKEPVKDLIPTRQMLADQELIAHGVLGGLGTEKTQVTLGPTYYYVLGFPLLFVTDPYYIPLFPIYFISLLNLLAAFLCYLFGKYFFDDIVGMIAASLFVLAPWNIAHVATILTPPNIIPLIIISLMYCVFKVIIQKQEKYLIAVGALTALLTHFHLATLIFVATVSLMFLVFRRSVISRKYFYFGALAGLLVLTPYIVYNLVTDNFDNTFSYLEKRDESTYSRSILEAGGIPFIFITPYFGTYLLGEGVSIFQHSAWNIYFYLLTGALVLLFIASVLYSLHLYSRTKDKRYGLLLIWLLAPPLLLALPGKNLSPHYFLMLLPVQFIILALFLRYLYSHYRKSTIAFLIIVLASFTFFTFSFYSYIEESGGTKGLYESPYNVKIALLNYIKEDAQGTVANIYFYKYDRITFNYLFELHGVKAQFSTVNSIADFKEGYLILDRYSKYSIGEKEMTSEENALVDQMPKTTIKHFEIIKK